MPFDSEVETVRVEQEMEEEELATQEIELSGGGSRDDDEAVEEDEDQEEVEASDSNMVAPSSNPAGPSTRVSTRPKHCLKFRLSAVRQVDQKVSDGSCEGETWGVKEVSAGLGISVSTLRQWKRQQQDLEDFLEGPDVKEAEREKRGNMINMRDSAPDKRAAKQVDKTAVESANQDDEWQEKLATWLKKKEEEDDFVEVPSLAILDKARELSGNEMFMLETVGATDEEKKQYNRKVEKRKSTQFALFALFALFACLCLLQLTLRERARLPPS
ncbi:unnamed protein product [Chrysoparadoxa australica]